jgi:hypothetical protein
MLVEPGPKAVACRDDSFSLPHGIVDGADELRDDSFKGDWSDRFPDGGERDPCIDRREAVLTEKFGNRVAFFLAEAAKADRGDRGSRREPAVHFLPQCRQMGRTEVRRDHACASSGSSA